MWGWFKIGWHLVVCVCLIVGASSDSRYAVGANLVFAQVGYPICNRQKGEHKVRPYGTFRTGKIMQKCKLIFLAK